MQSGMEVDVVIEKLVNCVKIVAKLSAIMTEVSFMTKNSTAVQNSTKKGFL